MNRGPTFGDLVRLMARLRAPDGCVWDRAQTHESLRPYLLEETYEVLDAIGGDPARLCDELGDLLLQVIFHAQMAAEAGQFKVEDVIAALHDKLIRRHPHIFGADGGAAWDLDTPQAVKDRWDDLKRAERGGDDAMSGAVIPPSALGEVPSVMPALMWSQKIQRRAARAGFDWPGLSDALAKVEEEMSELRAAAVSADSGAIHEEIGDALMTAVKVAALLGVDAEQALRDACRRFQARFTAMERAATSAGKALNQLSLAEMEAMWRDAKSPPS